VLQNFLHTCKPPIIHRDLKSPNLLVDKDLTVKVGQGGGGGMQGSRRVAGLVGVLVDEDLTVK
jgi:serine/threonine protein kinase